MIKKFIGFLAFSMILSTAMVAQHHDNPTTPPAHTPTAPHAPTPEAQHDPAHTGGAHTEEVYSPTENIMNHIKDASEYHLWGDVTIPLPCILYDKTGAVLKTFMSSVFHHGTMGFDGFVSDHGTVKRIKGNVPSGEIALDVVHAHGDEKHYVEHAKQDGKDVETVSVGGKKYELESAMSFLESGNSFINFSITKNVFTMLVAGLLLFFLFTTAARGYKTREGQAPKGIQSFFEPVIVFITDEVAKPMIGEKYMKFLPYLLTVFFFILTINLMGLIPLAPFGTNVTGNIAVTCALALIAFLVTNLNGKADYWKHIFWMPGVPVPMKIFLAPIEFLGVFTKPISLMIRLFANITAGHIIVLALVSLIFVFGNAGKSIGGATAGAAVAVPFTLFLSVIELIVAFIQAFIFTILTASYIGSAIEEHHHEEAHH